MNLNRFRLARSPRRGFLPVAALLLGVALVVPSTAAAAGSATALALLPRFHAGIFLSPCFPSHVAMDDPIVYPGVPGASHQHEFFGNVTTDAGSTYANLVGQGTTCRIKADTAAYWVPSVLSNGQRVAPIRVNAYYLRTRGPGRVVAFPPGLKIIAGSSHATTPQSTTITGWKCSGIAPQTLSPDPIACPAGSDNVLVIRFPNCWNGRDLDSADHTSHMSYRFAGACPAGFPVRVPLLSLNFHYHLPAVTGLTLASGSIYSTHADFFNAWNQRTLSALVRTRLN